MWSELLQNKHLRPCWWVFIGGVPGVFASFPDNGWSAPLCARHSLAIPGYDVYWDSLQVHRGFEPFGWRFDAMGGIVGAGPLTLRLVDHDGRLHRLFSTRLPTANRTQSRDELGHDAAGTGEPRYLLKVRSTAGFANEGPLYLGRETCYYTSMTADAFGAFPEDPGKFRRGCYVPRWNLADSRDRWHESYRHRSPGQVVGRQAVSDHPVLWQGRRVVLVQGFAHVDRSPVGTGFMDWDHAFELYQGQIAAEPEPDGADWRTWSLALRPLVDYLDTRVGLHTATGRVTLPGANVPWVHVDEGNNGIRIWNVQMTGSVPAGALQNQMITLQDGGGDVVNAWMTLRRYTRLAARTIKEWIWGLGGLWVNWPDTVEVVAFLGQERDRYFARIVWGRAPAGAQCALSLDLGLLGNQLPPEANGGWPGFWEGGQHGVFMWSMPAGGAVTMLDTARRIPFVLSGESRAYGRDFSATGGFAVLPTNEVVEYTGIESIAGAGGDIRALVVPVGGRGALGSQGVRKPLDLDGEGEIRDAVGFDGVPAWELLLRLALSSGAGHRDASYDVLPWGWGAGLCPSMFDVTSFENARQVAGAVGSRSLAFSRPEGLRELFESEATVHNAAITARTCADGRYRIGCYPIETPNVADAPQALHSVRARRVSRRGRVVTAVELPSQWSAGEGKHTGPVIVVRNAQAAAEQSNDRVLRLVVKGLGIGYGAASALGSLLASRLFWRYQERYVTLEIAGGADALCLQPGESIKITIPHLPTDEGGLGYSDRIVCVLGVEYSPYVADGDTVTTVHALVTPQRAVGNWAPNAKVTGYDPATLVIQCADNEFSGPQERNPWGETPTRDWTYFRPGFYVRVFPEGNWAAGTLAKVVSCPAPGSLELDVPLGFACTGYVLVGYQHWPAVVGEQRLFAYIGHGFEYV